MNANPFPVNSTLYRCVEEQYVRLVVARYLLRMAARETARRAA